MFTRLYFELEKVGYIMPDRGMSGKQLMPGIGVGLFTKITEFLISAYILRCATYQL
jgi:hypothetical protein